MVPIIGKKELWGQRGVCHHNPYETTSSSVFLALLTCPLTVQGPKLLLQALSWKASWATLEPVPSCDSSLPWERPSSSSYLHLSLSSQIPGYPLPQYSTFCHSDFLLHLFSVAKDVFFFFGCAAWHVGS